MVDNDLLNLRAEILAAYLRKRFPRADPSSVRNVLAQCETMEQAYQILWAQYAAEIPSSWQTRIYTVLRQVASVFGYGNLGRTG